MTTQTQVQGLGLFVHWGFTLEHPDDHILELLHEGELIARFSQAGATESSLQGECSRHLALYHHWDGCLWSKKEASHGS